MGKRIVVIGGVACGPKAAARARRLDPAAEITIVERGSFLSYAGCGMPYFISGVVKEMEDLMRTGYGLVRDVRFFERMKNVKALTRMEALAIDRTKKLVRVKDLASGETRELAYDFLVLATGAAPLKPPFPGLDLQNVFTLRRPEEAQGLRKKIEAGEAERVCIIGAGRIGLEVAEALANQAVDTTIVDLADQVLPGMLDPEMAAMVAQAVRHEGVKIYLGEKLTRLEGEDGKVSRVVTDQREIECDAALVAVGVRPEVALARAAGLTIGATGAIAVDDHLRTSDPFIFAGGDCAENTHLVTGKKVWVPLGSTANRHGRVIGDNLAGRDSAFPGIVGAGVLRTLGFNVGATGLTETQARELGYAPLTCLSPGGDKSHFYPGSKMIVIKMVADAKTSRLLGAQIVGPGEVLRRLDSVATALTLRATIDDVGNLDLAYAPPFGAAIEAVSHAANILRNKRDGLLQGVPPDRVRELVESDEDFILLDLRAPEELKKVGQIEDRRLKNIPLEDLRERLSELDPAKPVTLVCQVGVRSYEAACLMKGAGFREVKVMDGGMAAFLKAVKESG